MSSLPKMRFVGLYNKQKVYEGPRGGKFIRKNNYKRYLSPHYQTKIETVPSRCPLTEFAVAKKRRGACIPVLDTVSEWWFMREKKEVSHMNVIRELLYPRISDKNMRIALCKKIFTHSMPHTDIEFINSVKLLCEIVYNLEPDDWLVPRAEGSQFWLTPEGMYRVRARIHYHAPNPPQLTTRFHLQFTYNPDCGYGALPIPHALGNITWWADKEHMLEEFEKNKKHLIRWVAIKDVARTCPGCFEKKVRDRTHNRLTNTGMYCDYCTNQSVSIVRINHHTCNICKKVAPGRMKKYPRYGKCHIACQILQTCSKRDREGMKKQFRL
jgi:hypothetical protein